MKNRPIFMKVQWNKKSMGHNPHLFIKSRVKYKDTIPSYQDISPRISTEIDTNNQSDERPPQEYLDIMGFAQRWIYWKERDQRDINNEN